MSKINNFGITEDDINWMSKDNYIIEDDGDGFYSIDVEGLNELKGISYGFGSGDGHSYNCFREEGEGVGYGSASGSGDSNGVCVA